LILITNDDGIASPGLRAAARAALPLGDVLIAAPACQWSGAGRSMPHSKVRNVTHQLIEIDGHAVTAYAIDSSPAMVVAYALIKLAPRRPNLLISGINYGENLGSDITISGTVGAALQGAVSGVPGMAVSLQTPIETHMNPSDATDFTTATDVVRRFAHWMLQTSLPPDVDVLKIDIPDSATPGTPWRMTRVSRLPYFVIQPPAATFESAADPHRLDYCPHPRPERSEPDSDIYALAVDRVIAIAPLSLDMTSRTDRLALETAIAQALPDGHSHVD